MIKSLPLNSLTLSPDNVRKTPPTQADQIALMASILAHGLLENLVVKNRGTATYEVIAGGRRLQALKTLAERGEIAPDHLVACKLHEGESKEISLAENSVRSRMHPLDEFEAFFALATQGQSSAEIAHRFGVTQKVVEQRFKLAQVHRDILAAYRAEEITLESVMAFASCDDQGRQHGVWLEFKNRYITPQGVRSALYSESCTGGYYFALYVGEAAYLDAGGTIATDLFAESEEETSIWEQASLVQKLALEKLTTEVQALQAEEGWSWSHVTLARDWAFVHGLEPQSDGAEKAGLYAYIDYEGKVAYERGLVRPEDQREMPDQSAQEVEDQGLIHYSQSLKEDLGRERLAMTQRAIAEDFTMAFDLMLLTLLTQVTHRGYHFYMTYRGEPTLPTDNPLAALDINLDFLADETPKALSHLALMPMQEKQRLFAACSALHVRGGLGCDVLDHVGAALKIDVAAQWRPDVAVFKRLRKESAFAIAKDVLGDAWVQEHSTLKKGELAAVLADIFSAKQVGTLSATQAHHAATWLPEGMGFDWDREEEEDLPRAFCIVA